MKEYVIIMKIFIDFDKNTHVFYTNYYFEDINMVLKISIDNDDRLEENLKIVEFDLSKRVYITHL